MNHWGCVRRLVGFQKDFCVGKEYLMSGASVQMDLPVKTLPRNRINPVSSKHLCTVWL